jgi:hypothetical protein
LWAFTDLRRSAFSSQCSDAVLRYAAFAAEGTNQTGPWEKLKNQIFLGSEAFVASLQRNLNANARLREIPAIQRRPQPQPLAQIAEAHQRDEAIGRAYASGGYSLKEIGDHSGLHCSRVSRILKERRLAKGKT